MFPKRNQTLFILAAAIATGFAIGWWFLERGFPKPTLPTFSTDRPTSFQSVDRVPQGLFYYGGSSVWATVRQHIDPQIQNIHPQFRLNYKQLSLGQDSGSGSEQGIFLLLENQLDFAQSSRPLTKEEHQEAQQRGFALKEIPVAIDGIAVGVNPQLPVSNLTVRQVCQIYDGTITNWQEVGGSDLEIKLYIKPFTKHPFCNPLQQVSSRAETVSDTTTAIRKVKENLGGITTTTAVNIIPQCGIKSLAIDNISPYQNPQISLENCPTQRNRPNVEAFRNGTYPLTRRVWVLVKQNGLDAQKAGEAYAELLLTDEGQILLQDLGFAPLKPIEK